MDTRELDNVRPSVIATTIVMNVILNSLAIAVIARYPQLREDRTTLFMFSLSLSDLANGCTAMSISAVVCSSATPTVHDENDILPKIHALFSVWFSVTSMHSLCWVTICKMVAITNPLRYEQVLTRHRCYFVICGLWLTGAVMGAVVAYFAASWDYSVCRYKVKISKDAIALLVVVAIIAILCPVVGLVYSTSRIFLAILRTHRQISAQVISIGGENSHVATVSSSTLKAIQSGRNVLIVCLALVVLTIPYLIQATIGMLKLDKLLPSWFEFLATRIFLSNSFVNSLIYIVVFRSVRDKTALMLRTRCKL